MTPGTTHEQITQNMIALGTLYEQLGDRDRAAQFAEAAATRLPKPAHVVADHTPLNTAHR